MNKKMRWPLVAVMLGATVPMVWNFTPLTSGQRSKDINISNPRFRTPVKGNPLIQTTALQTLEGTLEIVWGDPRPGLSSGGDIRYALRLADGSVVQLQLTGQEGAAVFYFRKRVIVTGRTAQGQAAAGNVRAAATLVVDSIAPSRALQSVASPAVVGTKKVIYLLTMFSDDSAVPHPPVFYTDLNNPDTPPAGEVFPTTINAFFKKVSGNQFSWVGDVGGVGGVGAAGGWLTLPHPKSYYANCGWSTSCANLTALGDDATALGRAQGIDFKAYDNINFVVSNDLDCCAWGGGYFSSVDNQSYGATWEPPWGQNTAVYGHEMSHSLGLPHSGWVYSAYDSPWDTLSSILTLNNVVCGSYNSRNNGNALTNLNCAEPGDGYIIEHRDYLGWIPAANQVVANTSSSMTVALEASALPFSSAIKEIKICLPSIPCTGSTAHYFTVEARVKGLGATSQFDNAIPGEGVIIHEVIRNRSPISGTCFFNNQSGWAVPIDATPGDFDSAACNSGGRVYPNYGLFNAQWTPGQTYTNATYGLTIAVLSRTGSTFMVAIGGGGGGLTISSVIPPTGRTSGTQQIKLTGSFASLSMVTMGGNAASWFYTNGAGDTSMITVTTPAHAVGAVQIELSPVSGTSHSQPNAFAYLPTVFTDDSLVVGATTAKAQHILELRQAVDAMRAVAGLSPAPWTDGTLTPGSSIIKAIHIQELRTYLDDAATRLSYSTSAYTDAGLTSGFVIKRIHIEELRQRIRTIAG